MKEAIDESKKTEFPVLSTILGCGALAILTMTEIGPVVYAAPMIKFPAIIFAIVVANMVATLTAWFCKKLAGWLDLWAAKTPQLRKGTSKWASWWSLRKDILKYGWGPFWGVYDRGFFHRGKPIFADYASNAVTFGTAGSGKGVGVVLPTCLAIRDSKFLPDFKEGANSCMLKEALEKRGEVFRVLNIGDKHKGILGESACYNPMDIISDNFLQSGGLSDVASDAEEIATQLYPKNESGHEAEQFWRLGSIDLIATVQQQCALVHGRDNNLGRVDLLLNDKDALIRELLWASGRLQGKNGTLLSMPIEDSAWVKYHHPQDVENFIAWYRAKAGSLANTLMSTDNKFGESFLAGAQQALAPFNQTSTAHKVLSKSTFRFGEMKEGDQPVTVSVVSDPSRLETQSRITALLQWCAFTEWKRHSNKHRPVYVIHDETTNGKIEGLPSLHTWGREMGIRWHGFIQSIAAYEKVYGKQAVNTLLSETEIKQFLPNQRDPEMLDLIEKLLAEQSHVTKNHNSNQNSFGISGAGFQENTKPLMTADEIRRTDKTILFLKNNRPILTKTPSIASIHPWRKQIGQNPFYQKPYLQRIKLRIGSRKPPLLIRAFTSIFRFITGGQS